MNLVTTRNKIHENFHVSCDYYTWKFLLTLLPEAGSMEAGSMEISLYLVTAYKERSTEIRFVQSNVKNSETEN